MDPVKNEEMRRMMGYYRNNLTGSPPAGSGDDLYNDRVDNIKIDTSALTQTGTDDAGNPVMGNPLATPSGGEPKQQGSVLGNIIDFAYDRIEKSQGTAGLSGIGPVGAVMEGVTEFVAGTDEQRREMLNVPKRMENAAKRFIHNMSNATELEHTELYENYFYNAEKKNEEIKRIANILQIDPKLFMHDRDLYVKAALAAERVERMGKFRRYQDGEGNIDMAKIYADIPGLAEAQRKYGTPAAAMALGNMEGLQSVNDVYGNAFTRFVGSVYAGARRGWIADRRSAIWETARSERRLPTMEEQVQLDAYDEELRNIPKYNYNTVGGALGGFVGGAAENAAMILKSQVAGLAAGAVVGRFAGPMWAGYARDAAAVYVMADQISGSQYEELVNRTDEKGNRVYTPEQAALLARAQGFGEGILEQYSLKQIGGAIFGKSAAPALSEIIRKNEGLEAIKAGVRDYALVKLKEAAKAGAVSFSAEAAEEFEQAASDMLMENVAQVIINGKDADVKSLEDIVTESTAQMVEAFPALAGFSIIGFAGHPVTNTRAVLGFRSRVRQIANDKILQGTLANAHYGEVLSGIWQNRKNIQELHDKAPEVEREILDAQNRRAGIENGFVDVRTLAQQEGGEELVRQIAEANNISQDELAACMDGSGMLQVKTSTLMQMDMQEAQQKLVADNVTTSLDAATKAQYDSALEIARQQDEAIKKYDDKTYKQSIENIIRARFPEAEQAKLAREIIEANYDNPQAEFKRRLDAVNGEIMEEIEPVLQELRGGMKQGVDIVRMEGERDAKYVKQSNNADWYRNYYADYGRAPTEAALIDLAIDIASGRQDPRYGLQDYQNNTDESREYFAGVAEKLDNLVEKRDALMEIRDRMQELNAGEMAATATLSPEGLQVYDAAIRLMGTSNNEKVQKSGRLNALMVARYADNMAKVYARIKQKPYTAIDYVRDYLKIDVNAVQQQMQNAAQLMQEGRYTGLFEILPKNIQDEKKVEGEALADKLSIIREDAKLPDSKKRIKDRDEIFITHSSDIYKELGFGELDFVITAKDLEGVSKSIANKIGKHAPHEIYRDILKKLPMRLCSPIVVMDSVTKPGRVTILVDIDIKDDNGDPAKLFIPIEFNKQGFSKKINLVFSLYARNEAKIDNNLLSILNNETPKNPGAKIYYVNENKSTASKAMARVQFPATLLKYSASVRNTIAQKYGFVNYEKWADKNRQKYNQAVSLYQMAGPKALTANQEKLQRAMAMWEEGKPKEEIFKETGWVTGVDGKWRFEIPDLFNNIDPDKLKIPENKMMGESVKLSDVYDNPQLYEAYPWLRNIDVVVAYPESLLMYRDREAMANSWGYADRDNDMIVINAEKLAKTNNIEIRENLLHEIQHLIQDEEGFARGGGSVTVVRAIEKEIETLKGQARGIHPDAFAYYNREAELNRALLLGSKEEMDEARKSLEDFERNTPMTEEQKKKAWKVCSRINSLQKQLEKGRENPYRLYRLLAGEQEAESTAMRGLNLQLAKDRGEYEAELQNLPGQPFNAIVIFNGEEMPLQSAWHGTPNDFDAFSTDYMGSGEGAQAHGWGLYFAKNRQVSEEYKRKLSDYTRDYRIRSDGNIINNITRVINRYLGGSELAEAADNNNTEPLKAVLRNVIKDLSDENAFYPKTIRALKEQIGRIEANPKLSVATFLNGAPEDDWRYASIVKSAKAAAKAEGRKVTIADVKAGLERHLESFEEVRNKELEDLKVLQGINFDTLQVERSKGTLFEVDIPEEDVMLDEQKTLTEQPVIVQEAIQKLKADLQKNSKGIIRPERLLGELSKEDIDGKDIYRTLSSALGGAKAASLKLNEYGIKGITYDGRRDGRCFVMFDEKAISILNKYYQRQQARLKGSISLGERGRRIISLFEGADQSTFMHEMGHMFMLDLQEIAGIDPNSREAKDLKTIMDWAQYMPGQAEEYKGTSSYSEFRAREEAIKAAVAAGDLQEEQRLKEEWAQERFARGFEEYLHSGEAPARGLRKAFRQFKRWLKQVYADVTGAGVRATPEVEAIMARIVASEEEIEAMAAANNIARLKKLDPDILEDDLDAMHERWQEEAKERAKEKLLRQLMKQREQQQLQDIEKKLEEYRAAAQYELQNIPCFVCEEMLKQGNDMQTALDISEFGSEQEYRDALDAAGGSLQKAVEREVALERQRLTEQMPSREKLYEMAEEAMQSGDYEARLSSLEAEMLEARKKSYDRLPKKLQAAFADLDGALGDLKKESWANVKKKIQNLKYAARWQAEEYEMVKEFEDAAAKLENPEDREAVEKVLQKYQRIKERVQRNKDFVRGVRDATKGQYLAIKASAQAQMDRQNIAASTNPRHWKRMALKMGRDAWNELGKSQSKGAKEGAIAYNNAVSAKYTQAFMEAMASLAMKNRKRLGEMLDGQNGVYARAKRMADPKYKADANLRYFHNHLLYIFGLRKADAIAPVQMKAFTEVLAELRESHEFEEELPEWIIAAAAATQPGKDYQQMTMGEMEELDKATKILYRLARNKNRLLTLDMDMDDVRAECMQDFYDNVDYEVGNQRINEIKGAIGDYMNGLLKQEQILEILGGKQGGFVKYIYRVLFNAAEAEEKALEVEAEEIRNLYGQFYTHEELRAMVNDVLTEETEDGGQAKLQIGEDTDITKEHLLCMALNWGNRANRDRLLVGLFDCTNQSDLEQRGNELMGILQKHLTEKDWNFVQAMWDHIGTFADPVSEVMETSMGVPLDRVKAEAFEVELPSGKTLKMDGGYYPIVKDSGKSSRQTEFEQAEEAKAIGGASVFGAGISATKHRASNRFVNQGPLKLTLDVADRHIKAQIHYIHMRLGVRDAYKVLNDENIRYAIEHSCGKKTVDMLNEWVLNCWAPPLQPHNWLESLAAGIRSKTVSAIMAYRASTALLNAANVVYMAQEIGVKNALSALADFYKHPQQYRQEILDVSVFMRNRATNMDRDLNAQNERLLNRHDGLLGRAGNALDKATGGKSEEMGYLVDKFANWAIEQTDMMVSLPLYRWQFRQTYSEEIAKGVPEEAARETANFEATRRVTKVFGSSRAIDSSHVQRTRNEFVKLLTPFFSFANTMMNAVYSKYYEAKLKGKNYGSEKVAMRDADGNVLKDADGNVLYTTAREQDKLLFRHRYARFALAAFMNFFMGALVETMLRRVPDMLAGSGDDDDDEWKFAKEAGKNVISNAVAGFPGINEAINTTYTIFTEKRTYGRQGVGVLSGSVERFYKAATDIRKLTEGSDSIDAVDMMRDIVRLANTRTGFSDTLTDAVFNTVRFATDDGYILSIDNPDDLREYIAKSIFDRKLQKRN